MCFSAEASFGAGAVLAVAGVISVRKAETRRELAFSAIPFIFAVQQFTEGFVWLGLAGRFAEWLPAATYGFLIFAQIVWPVWVPGSILLLEKEPGRRKVLTVFLGMGLLVAGIVVWRLAVYGARASIVDHHIHYDIPFPDTFRTPINIMYMLATVASPFVSGAKGMKVLGGVILISFIVTLIFYNYNLISVWCFFAAVLSVVVIAVMGMLHDMNDSPEKRQAGG